MSIIQAIISNSPSEQNDPRRAFRAGLLSTVRHGPVDSRVPNRRYGALSTYPLQAPSNDQPGSSYEAAMVAGGVIHNASKLKLDAASIQLFMQRRITIPARFEEIVGDTFGSEDIEELSDRLAHAAVDYPKLVRYALGGKLDSAVRAMPAVGVVLENGSCFTKKNEEELLTLLTEVSGWLMLAALCDRGRAARRRIFKPTGIQALDRQEGKRGTTVATVANGLAYNSGWIGEILGFYWKSKDGLLTAEEERKITSIPGLVDHGLRELARLQKVHGSNLPTMVESWQRVARDGNRYIRRRLRALGRKHGNLTLTKYNGEDALMLLFLACLQVSAWNTDTTDKAITSKWDTINDGCRPKFNAVYRALKQIRYGLAPEPLAMPTRANTMARALFFLVRNLITNDPKACGFTGRKAPIDLDEVEKAYWVQAARRGRKGVHGKEPFATDVSKGSQQIYGNAVMQGNAAFLEEVHGPIWRQLHL